MFSFANDVYLEHRAKKKTNLVSGRCKKKDKKERNDLLLSYISTPSRKVGQFPGGRLLYKMDGGARSTSWGLKSGFGIS